MRRSSPHSSLRLGDLREAARQIDAARDAISTVFDRVDRHIDDANGRAGNQNLSPSWVGALMTRTWVPTHGYLAAQFFLDRHWDEITHVASAAPKMTNLDRQDLPSSHLRSFMFWDSGIDRAPLLVQRCHSAWERTLDQEGLVTLSDANLDRYLEIQPHLDLYREKHRAFFSDWLRFALLDAYGGAWLDATTYPGTRYKETLTQLKHHNGNFFAPRRTDRPLASGFIWSPEKSYITSMMRASLDIYMRNYTMPFQYFQMHYVFGALLLRDPAFAAGFGGGFTMDGHRWQRLWIIRDRPYRASEVRTLLRQLPVHKLSYKFDEGTVAPNSVLDHLLRHGTLWSR